MPSEELPAPVGAALPDAGKTDRSWKTSAADWLQFIRSVLFNGVVIAAIVGVVVFTVKDIWRQPVIIEKFGLPEALTQRGFSGAVAAQRVWDAMTGIQEKADTLKQTTSLLAESRQLDVVEPGTGLSLRSLTQMLRSLAGIEQTRIAGEVVCGSPDCDWQYLDLRLRVFAGGRMHIINSGPVEGRDPDVLFQQLALEALKIIDPYVYAAYHFAQGSDQAEAVRLANQMVDTRHPQSAWAANLLGNSAQVAGLHEEAIEWFERSARIAEDLGPRRFALPHYGRGNSLFALERYYDALRAFEQAIRYDRRYAAPQYGKGQALMALERYEDAAAAFRKASELDRSEPANWTGLGDAMVRMEDTENAVEHLQRAVRLNAEFVPARLALGRLLTKRGESAAAVRHLKLVTEIAPDLVPAWDSLASAFTAAGEEDEAEEAIQRAAELRLKQLGQLGGNLLIGWGLMTPSQ